MKRFGVICAMLGGLALAHAVEVPAIFGNDMILQRDREVRVWGKGRPGEKITVTFQGKSAAGTAGADGKWAVTLPPFAASSAGAVLTVAGDNTIRAENVLVGDVWICAGQSNMDWYLDGITEAREYLAATDQPGIRLLRIRYAWSRVPQDDLRNGWQVSNRKSAENFSAVGYIAGLEIHRKTGVPVGLISVAVGGARIEAMCAPESFRKAGVGAPLATAFETSLRDFGKLSEQELPKEKQRSPAVIFNAMIHPATPFAVRGLLWYQGEENYADGMRYAEKMRALAWTMRTSFKTPDMPIFVVMLPPWNYHGDTTGCLPRLWAAQRYFAEHDKNAGFIVTTDCGSPDTVHPMSKKTLALRLANLVLYREYGIGDDSALAPAARKAVRREGRVRVDFDHAGGLRTRDGKPVSHLELAGKDGKFHPATGTLSADGASLEASAPEVKAPVKIRFGIDQLADPNLVNRAGVPAAPFELEIR